MSRNDLIVRNSRPWLILLAIAAWCASASAMALEENQVRGQIVDINETENRLSIDVEEAGADMTAREGRTETYVFDENTEIRMEDPRETVLDPVTMTIGDLQEGTTVTLDFEEIDGELVARGLALEDEGAVADTGDETTGDTDAALADADEATDDEESASELAAMESERDELPATASALPLLALLGAGFAGLALLLRIRRR